MMTLLCAKLSGPEKIITTDIAPFKRETALKHGAHMAIDPLDEDPVEAALDATGGDIGHGPGWRCGFDQDDHYFRIGQVLIPIQNA